METSDETSNPKAMKSKLPICFPMRRRPDKSIRLNWETFVVCSLVVVSFAALFFAGYVIWAKCNGS